MPIHSFDPNKGTGAKRVSAAVPEVSAAVAPRRPIGLNCDPTNPAHLAGLRSLGVTRVRATLYWINWPDGAPGETVAACAAEGLDLLMVVHMPPKKFDNDRASGTPVLAELLADRAAAWPGLSWQIMNEMDGSDDYNGAWYRAADSSVTQLQRGQWYGETLDVCGKAIRAADSTARVIGGGIALAPEDVVRGILETCERSSFDALAVHAYGQPDVIQFSTKSEAIRAIDPTIPVWCTEFGSLLTDHDAQAAELLEVFHDQDANNRYERAYLYALEDETSGYGIMSHAGVMRPSSADHFVGRVVPKAG